MLYVLIVVFTLIGSPFLIGFFWGFIESIRPERPQLRLYIEDDSQ